MTSLRAAWMLVLLSIGLTSRAEQRTLATVALALEPGMETQALETWRALDVIAPRDPRYAFVDLARRSPDVAAREDKAEQARAAHAAAKEAYEGLDMARAIERVDQAIQLFEASDLSRSFRELLECLALKAFLLQARGSPAASEVLIRLFTLSPSYRFNASRMNPKFLALAERIRGQVSTSPRGTIQVRPPNGRAWVFVDGELRGISPLDVSDLPAGPHYVTLLAPGFQLAQEMVVLKKKEAVFSPRLTSSASGQELETHLARLGAGLRQSAYVQPANELHAWAEVDEVLVVALAKEDSGSRATLLRLSGNGQPPLVAQVPAGPGTSPEALAKAALDLLDRGLQGEPPGVAAREPVAHGGRIPRLWGYASMGAGAVAALGGILVGQEAQRQARETRAIPQLEDARYQSAAAAARGTALVADGLLAVALAGIGAGTWILLTDDRTPAPKDAVEGPGQLPLSLGMTPLREGGAITLSGGF